MADENNGNGNPPTAGEIPETMRESLEKLTADWTNSAISNRFSQFEKRQDKKLEELFSKKLDSFAEKLQKTAPTGKGKDKDDSDPQTNSLRSELEELKRALETEKLEKKATRAQLRMNELRKNTEQELIKHGADPARVEFALDHLIDAKRRIAIDPDDDDSRPVFRGDDGHELDLETGIKGWMKSEKGQHFAKSKAVAGTGARPPTQQRAPTNTKEAEESYIAKSVQEGLAKLLQG